MIRALVLLAAALVPSRNPTPSLAPRPPALAQTQAATAPAEGSSLDLDWHAPSGCPEGSAIRSEALRLAGATANGPRRLKARAATTGAQGSGWSLSLTTDLDGVVGERTLTGISCQSLAEAATLTLALILNPDLVLTTPPVAAPPPPADGVTTTGDRWAWRWRVGILGGVQAGAMAKVSSAFALSLGVALGHLSLRLLPGISLAQDIYIDAEQKVGGRLWLGSAAALGCYAGALGWLAIEPCLGTEVTRLQGRGLGVVQPRDTAAYWTSADLALFVGIPVGYGVHVELAGIGQLPLGRPTMYLEGIGQVSRPAAMGLKALGGLAWVF